MKLKIILSLLLLLSFAKSFSQISICSNWTPGENIPPGCLFCSTSISGENVKFIETKMPNGFSCGTIENNFFFAIRSDSLGNIKLRVSIESCSNRKGLEGVFYDENLNEITDCFEFKLNSAPQIVEVKGLNSLKNYTLMLDGIDGDVCKYEIDLLTEIGIYPDFSARADTIAYVGNPAAHCQGAEAEFSTAEVLGATNYDWRYPSFSIPVWGEKNRIKLKMIGTSTFPQVLEVVPYLGCSEGIRSDVLVVYAAPIRVGVSIPTCRDRLPIMYEGLEFNDFFLSKNLTFTTREGCDSIISFRPVELNENRRSLDTVFCAGDVFNIDGHEFTTPGNYEFSGSSSTPFLCDTMITMSLSQEGNIPPIIKCTPDTFLNIISFKWEKFRLVDSFWVIINGDTVSNQTDNFFILSSPFPGEMIEFVVQPLNEQGCDYEPGTITCFTPDLTNLKENDRANQIKISPNPSTGIFQISSFFKIEKTEVFDFSGRRILIEKGSEIDLTNYAEGVYVFKIYTEKGVGVNRVFKN